MRAFEIHTFRDGKWKVDSVFDDRELAIHEARKVDEGRRYSGVRVIEETYDESTDHTTTRTIFRGRKKSAKSKALNPTARNAGRAAYRGGAERARSGKYRARRRKKKSTSVVVPVLALVLMVMTGIVVVLGIRYVGGLE